MNNEQYATQQESAMQVRMDERRTDRHQRNLAFLADCSSFHCDGVIDVAGFDCFNAAEAIAMVKDYKSDGFPEVDAMARKHGV